MISFHRQETAICAPFHDIHRQIRARRQRSQQTLIESGTNLDRAAPAQDGQSDALKRRVQYPHELLAVGQLPLLAQDQAQLLRKANAADVVQIGRHLALVGRQHREGLGG